LPNDGLRYRSDRSLAVWASTVTVFENPTQEGFQTAMDTSMFLFHVGFVSGVTGVPGVVLPIALTALTLIFSSN